MANGNSHTADTKLLDCPALKQTQKETELSGCLLILWHLFLSGWVNAR